MKTAMNIISVRPLKQPIHSYGMWNYCFNILANDSTTEPRGSLEIKM